VVAAVTAGTLVLAISGGHRHVTLPAARCHGASRHPGQGKGSFSFSPSSGSLNIGQTAIVTITATRQRGDTDSQPRGRDLHDTARQLSDGHTSSRRHVGNPPAALPRTPRPARATPQQTVPELRIRGRGGRRLPPRCRAGTIARCFRLTSSGLSRYGTG
jgi:hypothetical protein